MLQRREQRPRYDGSHSACHKWEPQLSGAPARPDNQDPSSPSIKLSAHPIGGFCALSKKLPLPQLIETEVAIDGIKGNGMNAVFGEAIHCVAAEPHATFIRVEVIEEEQEIAFETAVLGRLRHGYRVLQMRSRLGTRIELCFSLVKIGFGDEAHMAMTSRQVCADSPPSCLMLGDSSLATADCVHDRCDYKASCY